MTEPKNYTDAELMAVIRLAMDHWEEVYGRNIWKQWTYEDADYLRETGSHDKPSTRDRIEQMFFGIMMGESSGKPNQKYYNKNNKVPTWDYGFLQINQQYTNTRNEINGPLDEGFPNWYNKDVSWSSFTPDLISPPFDVEQLLTSPLYSMYAGLSLGQYYADMKKSPKVDSLPDPLQHWAVYNDAVRRPAKGPNSAKANWAKHMKDYNNVIEDIGAWDKEIVEQQTIRENEERKRVIEDYEKGTRTTYNLQDDPQNFMAPLESSPFGREDDSRYDPFLGDHPAASEVEQIRQHAMHRPNPDGSFSFGKEMVSQPPHLAEFGTQPPEHLMPPGQEFGATMGSFNPPIAPRQEVKQFNPGSSPPSAGGYFGNYPYNVGGGNYPLIEGQEIGASLGSFRNDPVSDTANDRHASEYRGYGAGQHIGGLHATYLAGKDTILPRIDQPLWGAPPRPLPGPNEDPDKYKDRAES
jgi:hypothetical protein